MQECVFSRILVCCSVGTILWNKTLAMSDLCVGWQWRDVTESGVEV